MLELFFTTLLCLMSLFPKDGVMVDLLPSKLLLSLSLSLYISLTNISILYCMCFKLTVQFFFFLVYVYVRLHGEMGEMLQMQRVKLKLKLSPCLGGSTACYQSNRFAQKENRKFEIFIFLKIK